MRIIAGEARGRKIEAPEGKHTRPTLDRVRENIFNMLQNDIPYSRVLDLFAGSGALSLEALSRGALSAIMVDSDRGASAVQKKNTQTLRYSDRVKIYCCDWTTALKAFQLESFQFDVVFLDPPYAMTDLRAVFTALIPFVHNRTLIVVEHESGSDILVPDHFGIVKNRSWGYCAATVYCMFKEGE